MYIRDSNILLQSDNKPLSQMNNGDNGQYYKRYKDGEFYFSSKFLKDAVIDSGTNEIEVLNSSLGIAYVRKTTNPVTTQVKISKSGILFDGANLISNSLKVINYPVLGNSNFYIGFHHLFNAYGSNNSCYMYSTYSAYGGVHGFMIYHKAGVFYVFIKNLSGESSTFSFPYNINTGTFYYITVMRINFTYYVCINGYLQAIEIDTNSIEIEDTGWLELNNVNNYTDRGLVSQYCCNMVLEDLAIFIDDDVPIDPTGKTVGQKAFEPPRRGGFNSDIKQY